MTTILRYALTAALLFGSTSWAAGQAAGLLEYAQGEKTTYAGDGTGKCLGLKFTLRYPSSWKAADGNRPHIVQKFMNGNGGIALVIIKDMRGVTTKSEMDEHFTNTPDLSEFTPDNSTFIRSQRNFTIDGEKAYSMEFTTQQTGATGMTVYQHSVQYMLFYDHYMITVMCSAGGQVEDKSAIEAQFERSRPFFGLIGSSFVLTSKWNNR